jgi:hypothetical protein
MLAIYELPFRYFLEEIKNIKNSIPYKKCVTEKRTKVKTLLTGSFPNLLTALLSILFNKLPCTNQSMEDFHPNI